jgi:hypothetical protein
MTSTVSTEDQRQPVLSGANNHPLGILCCGQTLVCFDPFPSQQLLANTVGTDSLEVGYALGFNAVLPSSSVARRPESFLEW